MTRRSGATAGVGALALARDATASARRAPGPEVSELPAILTLEETAAFLRIGRSAAYEGARRYEATGGAVGIPVIRVGRLLRVPRDRLVAMLGLDESA